jgi:predicted RNA polymerase sigma factor
VHDEAPSSAATDWPQIVALYEVLLRISANPVVALNHAVAVAMRDGPAAGLDLIAGLGDTLDADHRLYAVRAHLHAMAGDHAAARADFAAAAERTMSLQQQRYLHRRARREAARTIPAQRAGQASEQADQGSHVLGLKPAADITNATEPPGAVP